MDLQKLYDKRAALVKGQRDILDKAKNEKGEKRELTADEVTAYEQMEADYAKVEAEIKNGLREKEVSSRERELENFRENSGYRPSRLDEKEDKARHATAQKGYHDAFFDGFARRGKNGMDRQHYNALEAGTDSEGGYLVPEEWAMEVIRAMAEINVVRRYAKVITTRSDRNLPLQTSRGAFTWIDEEGAYSTNDPVYGNAVLGAHKVGGIIKVSEELLLDNAYNLPANLRLDATEEFADKEEEGFVNGDGSGKPTGLFQTTAVGGVNVTGTQGATSATPVITADNLIDTYHGLPRKYRRRATWLAGDAITKQIRKLKDGDDQYLWRPGLTEAEPDRLLGRPYEVSDAAPAPTVSGKSLVFGDLGYYTIADRLGMTMQRLNELYAANGQIGFKFMKRVEGKMTLAEALTYFQHGAAS